MIPAAKSRFFTAWLAYDAGQRIRRGFTAMHVHGLDRLRGALGEGPVLVVSNHTSWWDPLVLQYVCSRVLRADAHAMMDAKNLARLPFFRKVGAFGVDLDDPRDGIRAVRYAAKLLDRPGRLVWVFPQGREVPLSRPLAFRPGAAMIARLAKTACVMPAALRYEMAAEPLPHLWLSIGEPLAAAHDVEEHVALERAGVSAELARIDAALDAEAHFDELHRQREGLVFRAAQAALAWLTR